MSESASTGYAILDWMIREGIPFTRENYLDLDFMGDVPQNVNREKIRHGENDGERFGDGEIAVKVQKANEVPS